MEGHAAHDTAWYVPKKLLEEWGKKDPLARLEALLLAGGILTAPKLRAMAERAKKLVDGALTRALDAPYPPGEAAVRGVYAPAGER
jgi:2-oxoisovalerate dehydrogenase E1 component